MHIRNAEQCSVQIVDVDIFLHFTPGYRTIDHRHDVGAHGRDNALLQS